MKLVSRNQTLLVPASSSKTGTQLELAAEDIGSLAAEPKIDTSQGDAESWSQTEQMVLETMLRQYPKGTEQRWEKIAENLSNKTKVCIIQYFDKEFKIRMEGSHYEQDFHFNSNLRNFFF